MIKHTTTGMTMTQAQATAACRTMVVDLAKHVFQVAGEDASGRVAYEAFGGFMQAVAPGEILLEPGTGAQAWARALQAAGKPVRLLAAQRVAEHRRGPRMIATMPMGAQTWRSCR